MHTHAHTHTTHTDTHTYTHALKMSEKKTNLWLTVQEERKP